jgi:RNA polymerase sigma-70 factor (ECF subfamily)
MDRPDSKTDFESLYSDHFPQVQRFVGQLVRDSAVAEELAQETFLKVYGSLDSYRGEASARTWLFKIARNLSIDYLRSPRALSAQVASLDSFEGDDAGLPIYNFTIAGKEAPRSVEEQARQGEMGECVRSFVEDLPETLRTPLILHDVEELTNPEIAAVLGCSLEAVKMRLHRARGRLREMMDERCDLFHDDLNVLACLPAAACPPADCDASCESEQEAYETAPASRT